MAGHSSPRTDARRVALLKAFYTDILEEKEYIADRRKLLRVRAGFKATDYHKVPKFTFLILDQNRITEKEAEASPNFEFVMMYLAAFAADPPRAREVQEALTWASQHYQLNPRREEFEHQAWAITESSLHRALAGYCLDRFQRYRHARKGHDHMAQIKEVIRAKLEEASLLMPDGKKRPSRGLGIKRLKEQLAIDNAETQLLTDTQPPDTQSEDTQQLEDLQAPDDGKPSPHDRPNPDSGP
ncbi:unnamed protein product [Effrenium voratum]|nr:unnamed protein product [Effrenium voratum]